MLECFVKWLYGYLYVRIKGNSPERFINLCNAKDISLWNIEKTENGYGFMIGVHEFRHILGELEKIATHYGVIRQGKLIMELSAKDMDSRSRTFVSLKTSDMSNAFITLKRKYGKVKEEDGYLRIYDVESVEEIVEYLLVNNHVISEIKKNKVGLEEYYIELMSKKEDE